MLAASEQKRKRIPAATRRDLHAKGLFLAMCLSYQNGQQMAVKRSNEINASMQKEARKVMVRKKPWKSQSSGYSQRRAPFQAVATTVGRRPAITVIKSATERRQMVRLGHVGKW